MTKLVALPADASPTLDDLVYMINAPGTVPVDRKVVLGDIAAPLAAAPAFDLFVQQDELVTNVKDYGAVGDGATNDTAAFHAARDAAGVGGTVAVLTPGVYRLNGLLLNQANQHWHLAKGVTLKILDSVTQNVLNIAASGITITGGGTLDGNRSAGGVATGIYDTLQGADDLTIEGITVQNTTGYGIQIYGSRCAVRRCKLLQTLGAGVLYVSSGTNDEADGEITDCYVDRSTEAASLTDAALWIGGQAGHLFKRAIIANNIVRMPLSPTNAGASPICIEMTAVDGGTITGNTTYGGSMGVSLGGADHTVVSGNVLRAWSWWGVEVASTSTDCAVTGNVIDGEGIGGGGATGVSNLSGITTNDACVRPVISGNTISGLISHAQGVYGITLQSTAAGALVAANYITTPTDGIIGGGAATFVGNVITKTGAVAGSAFTFSDAYPPGTGLFGVVGGEASGFLNGIRIVATTQTVDNVLVDGVAFRSCTNPWATSLSGTGALGTNILRRNCLPFTANTALAEVLRGSFTAGLTVGAGVAAGTALNVDGIVLNGVASPDINFSPVSGATKTFKINQAADEAFLGSVGVANILSFQLVAATWTALRDLTMANVNMVLGTGAGTMFATTQAQKLAFHGSTPIAQQAGVANATDAASAITQLNALITRLEVLGLIATV